MIESDYVLSLDKEEKLSYFEKLKQLGFVKEEDDPFIEEEPRSNEHVKKWSTSVDCWPKVEFGDIYVYLIDCPGYTPRSLKAYKSLDAYNAFVSGWVYQLNIRQNDTDHCIIRASVNKTHNISDGCHKAWVGFKNTDGSILSGHCTCMNGSATICSHAVAIMFQVEAAHRLCNTGKTGTVCAKDVPEPQENVSSTTSSEDASVIKKCKSDDAKSQEEWDDDINISPEISDTTRKTEVCMNNSLGNNIPANLKPHKRGRRGGVRVRFRRRPFTPPLPSNYKIDELISNTRFLNAHFNEENHPKALTASSGSTTKTGPSEEQSELLKARNHPKKDLTPLVQKPFQCDECGKRFTHRGHLNSHMSIHMPKVKKSFKCNDCGWNFTRQCHLRTHMRIHTGEKPYKCNACDRRFMRMSYFYVHVKIHLRENPFVCTKCGQIQCTDTELEEHMKSHTSKMKTFACDMCDEKFKQGKILKDHMKTHKKKPCYRVCNRCGKNCESRRRFQSHMRTHAKDVRSFKCSGCEKTYPTQKGLTSHMRLHTGEKPFHCIDCGKGFTRQRSLLFHRTIHSKLKPFMCHQCGKSFRVSLYLRRHMVIHTGDRPHICKDCGKSFHQASFLRRHQKTHSGEKPYLCSQCGKGFLEKFQLQRHDIVHTEVKLKSFKCSECNQCFSQKAAYSLHMRKHVQNKGLSTNEKDQSVKEIQEFRCSLCGKIFRSKQYRDMHEKVHKGESPFKCDTCGRNFVNNRLLQVHVNVHVQEEKRYSGIKSKIDLSHMKMFDCDTCGKAFTAQHYRDAHAKVHIGAG